jgi:hypothetical protein
MPAQVASARTSSERTRLLDVEKEGGQHVQQGQQVRGQDEIDISASESFFKQRLLPENQTKLWIFTITLLAVILIFGMIGMFGLTPREKGYPSSQFNALNVSATLSLRWGIVGLGRISDDFAVALLIAGANLTAVAAGSLPHAKSRSIAFGQRFGLPKAKCYGSYEELAADPDVDIVYIGNTNQLHYNTALLMIDRSKHVLVEKVHSPPSPPLLLGSHSPQPTLANCHDNSRNEAYDLCGSIKGSVLFSPALSLWSQLHRVSCSQQTFGVSVSGSHIALLFSLGQQLTLSSSLFPCHQICERTNVGRLHRRRRWNQRRLRISSELSHLLVTLCSCLSPSCPGQARCK